MDQRNTIGPAKAIFLLLRCPRRFEIEAEKHAGHLRTQREAAKAAGLKEESNLRKAARGIRQALSQSFLCISATLLAGWLTAKLLHASAGPVSPCVNKFLQWGGVLVLLWATLAKQGWNIQTINGESLPELVNDCIYRSLYVFGSWLLVISALWPTASHP